MWYLKLQNFVMSLLKDDSGADCWGPLLGPRIHAPPVCGAPRGFEGRRPTVEAAGPAGRILPVEPEIAQCGAGYREIRYDTL